MKRLSILLVLVWTLWVGAQGIGASHPYHAKAGEVAVYHVNGKQSVYRASGGGDHERGAALLRAAAASAPREVIAIGPGVYELPASLICKRGQTIVGAGAKLTTLRWAPLSAQPTSTAGTQLIGNNYFTQTDGVTVRRMTIDCNAQSHAAGVGVEGVVLNGSNCTIEDLKVINPGRTDGNECFPVAAYSGESKTIKRNTHIRRVEVTQPAAISWPTGLSCIGIGGVYYDSSIEECYVHDIDVGDSSGTVIGKPRYIHAFGMSGSSEAAPACKHGRVVRNRAINLTGTAGAQGAGIYTDTGSVEGYEISDNVLLNTIRGIHLHEATLYKDVKITRNKIRFISELNSNGGIILSAKALINCFIAENDVAAQKAVTTSDSYAIAIMLAKNLVVQDNMIRMPERRGEVYIDPANQGVVFTNNRRPDGSRVPNYKRPSAP